MKPVACISVPNLLVTPDDRYPCKKIEGGSFGDASTSAGASLHKKLATPCILHMPVDGASRYRIAQDQHKKHYYDIDISPTAIDIITFLFPFVLYDII